MMAMARAKKGEHLPPHRAGEGSAQARSEAGRCQGRTCEEGSRGSRRPCRHAEHSHGSARKVRKPAR